MQIAACLWSLPVPPADAAEFAASAGFDSIDVDPGFASIGDRREQFGVTSIAAAHGLRDGLALDSDADDARQRAVEHVQLALGEAHALGANFAYVSPPATPDAPARDRYRESLRAIADEAQIRGIRLGIEHFPGMGLPTVAATMEFIEESGHANLYLCLDIGHTQIVGEDFAESVARAGDRLGYVHFDDNDTTGDQHLALLAGIQDEAALASAVQVLRWHGYPGPLAIETNPRLDDPQAAMSSSLRTLRRALEQA